MLSDPTALELLFSLLEARELSVTQRVLLDYHGSAGKALLASGLLEPAGHETSFIASDEDDLPIYPIVVNRRGDLGYYSSRRGWVRVQQALLQRYELRVDATFSMLFKGELRRPPKGILEIEPGYIWEMGLLRLVKHTLTPVWYARRLYDLSIQQKTLASIARRPSHERRLILTSTPHQRLTDSFALAGAMVLPISDILDSYAPDRIDIGRLRTLFQGKDRKDTSDPIHLSEDGATLTILGTETVFGGDNQRRAIRLLVDAYIADKGLNASRTLEKAGFGSSTRTFQQAFKKQWPSLQPYLKAHHKLWRFEL